MSCRVSVCFLFLRLVWLFIAVGYVWGFMRLGIKCFLVGVVCFGFIGAARVAGGPSSERCHSAFIFMILYSEFGVPGYGGVPLGRRHSTSTCRMMHSTYSV